MQRLERDRIRRRLGRQRLPFEPTKALDRGGEQAAIVDNHGRDEILCQQIGPRKVRLVDGDAVFGMVRKERLGIGLPSERESYPERGIFFPYGQGITDGDEGRLPGVETAANAIEAVLVRARRQGDDVGFWQRRTPFRDRFDVYAARGDDEPAPGDRELEIPPQCLRLFAKRYSGASMPIPILFHARSLAGEAAGPPGAGGGGSRIPRPGSGLRGRERDRITPRGGSPSRRSGSIGPRPGRRPRPAVHSSHAETWPAAGRCCSHGARSRDRA